MKFNFRFQTSLWHPFSHLLLFLKNTHPSLKGTNWRWNCEGPLREQGLGKLQGLGWGWTKRYKERPGELGSFSLEKVKLWEQEKNLIIVCHNVKESYREDGAKIFSDVHKFKGRGCQSQCAIVCRGVGKNSLLWLTFLDRVPRDDMEVFKTPLGEVHRKLVSLWGCPSLMKKVALGEILSPFQNYILCGSM